MSRPMTITAPVTFGREARGRRRLDAGVPPQPSATVAV
jgi:hypothetical protein